MKFFEKNVGLVDRILRAFFGILALIGVYIGWVVPPVSYGVLLIGLIWVLTAGFGTCMVYSLFGFNTCRGTCKKTTKL